MVDPVTVATAGGVAAVAKLFGPTADAIGEYLASFIPQRKRNAERILDNASMKAADRDGTASPRVVADALEDGSWAEDDIVTAYLGGAIAASVADGGGDDRALPWSKLINRLSSDALAVHHAIYESMHRLRESWPTGINMGLQSEVTRAFRLFVPTEDLLEMADDRMAEALGLLYREGLIESWLLGESSQIQKDYRIEAETHGLMVVARRAGVSLYLVGYGAGSNPHDFVRRSDFGPMTSEDRTTLPTFSAGTLHPRSQ